MADPILDENLIIDLIDTTPTPDTVMRLMAGANMLLLDAYDRKITRDAFITVAHSAICLHSYASQYGGILNMQRLLNAGKLDSVVLDDTIKAVIKLVEHYTNASLKQARLLRECPLSLDKVH